MHLRTLCLFAAASLLGCTPPEASRPDRAPIDPSTGGPTATVTGPTGGTTVPETVDCTFEPAKVPVQTVEFPISTEEDFAFDADGHLLYQAGTTIVGSGPKGGTWIAGTGAPGDPSGLAMRSNTELVIAAPDSGSVERLDLDTGALDTLITGLAGPNGLTADAAGRVFVSERPGGAVTVVDPDTGAVIDLAKGFQRPNGLALDETQSLLYVTDEQGIWVIERFGPDWVRAGAPELVYEAAEGSALHGIAVDLCGYVSAIDYTSGRVIRVDPDTGEDTLLVDLVAGASFGFGALEYGNGGAWPRGMLFTSNRRVVTGLVVGIPGPTPVASGIDR